MTFVLFQPLELGLGEGIAVVVGGIVSGDVPNVWPVASITVTPSGGVKARLAVARKSIVSSSPVDENACAKSSATIPFPEVGTTENGMVTEKNP